MKFKSQVYTQASGSVGGLTYAHTRGVMYTRGRGIPTNPQTPRQQIVQNALGAVSASWGTLTDAEREAWRLYATNSPTTNAFGDPLVLTGQQMYNRVNTPRVQASEAILTVAPTTFGLSTLSPVAIAAAAASPGTVTGTVDPADEWATDDDGLLFVYVGVPRGPGRRFYKGPFRFAAAVAGNTSAPPTTTGAIADPDEFDYTAGQIVTVRLVAQAADGRPSTPQLVTATVA